jgi:hypothetical protein
MNKLNEDSRPEHREFPFGKEDIFTMKSLILAQDER